MNIISFGKGEPHNTDICVRTGELLGGGAWDERQNSIVFLTLQIYVGYLISIFCVMFLFDRRKLYYHHQIKNQILCKTNNDIRKCDDLNFLNICCAIFNLIKILLHKTDLREWSQELYKKYPND